MKNYFFVLIASFLSNFIAAQVPQAFSFQGVAMNDDGSPVVEKQIGIEASIVQGSPNGQILYTERHSITTTKNGLYSLAIGTGQILTGDFQSINWSSIPMFLSVSIDIENTSSFKPVGTTQLLSVPYALKAGEANIKPAIYVRSNPVYVPAVIFNRQDYTGLGKVSYYYEWIHGLPENVYVEFQGLPDNVSIFTTSLGEFHFLPAKINSSKVDTIYDGIVKPQSFLGVGDKSTFVAKGKYPLNLVFRTESEILASLPFDLLVYDNYFDDCFFTLPATKPLKSNSCSEISSFLAPSITLDIANVDKLTITNIFDPNRKDGVNFQFPAECNFQTSVFDFGVAGYALSNRVITQSNNIISNNFNITNQTTNETKSCTVTYE